ncbi:SAV_915 family protein [Streptomyces bungoensis]|uniref:SAV_915 family protein n=1 Tax=Streptomyces bungoensis TaxID=285568 RepID=UPI000A971536|nr:SAV_915 family protein [Streptomyces bungoensis]
MGAPIRSRLLELDEPDPPGRELPDGPVPRQVPGPRRSTLLDLAEAAPPPPPAADGRARPRPGVPAYHTPVCVPAHPRSVAATGPDGRPARVPFVVVELFAHPGHGTVAFAFSTPAKLAAALGGAQPWVAASIGPLAESLAEQGAGVLLDPRVAPGASNWRPADVAAYAREAGR